MPHYNAPSTLGVPHPLPPRDGRGFPQNTCHQPCCGNHPMMRWPTWVRRISATTTKWECHATTHYPYGGKEVTLATVICIGPS